MQHAMPRAARGDITMVRREIESKPITSSLDLLYRVAGISPLIMVQAAAWLFEGVWRGSQASKMDAKLPS
jgi:hypothetical protein